MKNTKTTNQERGKKARKSGGHFERRVRGFLEDNGWIVTKWQNQVDLDADKMVAAPHKFNFFTKSITPGQGFPDFVCFDKAKGGRNVIGVESKSAKYLDKDEKAKCKWYLEHNIFDKIIIMYKDRQGHIAEYEFKEDV